MRQIAGFILLAAVLGCAATSASAQWYVGASVGRSDTSASGNGQADQLLDLGFDDASSSRDERDTMYRVLFGYRLHRYVAVEAAYVDLGRFGIHSTVLPAGTLDTSIRNDGADVSVLGLWPIGDRFTVFGRVGGYASRTRASYSSSGSVDLVDGQHDQTRRSTQLVYGAGAMFDITPALGLRLDWARYRNLGNDLTGGEFDADTWSAGIQWRF